MELHILDWLVVLGVLGYLTYVHFKRIKDTGVYYKKPTDPYKSVIPIKENYWGFRGTIIFCLIITLLFIDVVDILPFISDFISSINVKL